jgi:hypothetical protein
VHTPGSWMPSGPPGSSASMPPVMPPRKFTFVYSSSLLIWPLLLFRVGPQSGPYPGPGFPTASTTGSSAYGMAMSAVDRVAGRKTRVQLESQVENIAQSKRFPF